MEEITPEQPAAPPPSSNPFDTILQGEALAADIAAKAAKAKSAPLPAFDRATFKRSATELSRLLLESDPGAQDCMEDYQAELRPAFTPDSYAEFAQRVRESDFHEALALLGKAARKHGVTLRHE